MKDVDNQDAQQAIFNINGEKLLIKRQTENWIRLRKNAGMKVFEKLNDMEFAKQIFKAWDISNKGYLTAKDVSE